MNPHKYPQANYNILVSCLSYQIFALGLINKRIL